MTPSAGLDVFPDITRVIQVEALEVAGRAEGHEQDGKEQALHRESVAERQSIALPRLGQARESLGGGNFPLTQPRNCPASGPISRLIRDVSNFFTLSGPLKLDHTSLLSSAPSRMKVSTWSGFNQIRSIVATKEPP